MSLSDAQLHPESRAALLGRSELLAGASPAVLAKLAPFSRIRPTAKGETLFQAGDPGTALMAVIEGCVAIGLPSVDGRTVVIRTLGPGDVFGEIAMLDGNPRTADATVLAAGRLLVVERRELRPLLRSDPGLALAIIALLCGRLRETSATLGALWHDPVPQRLASALLHLDRGAAGWIEASQRELAERIGARRETVSRWLARWGRSGLTATRPGAVRVLDAARLAVCAKAADP